MGHNKNIPQLTRDDFNRAGYCDHGKRVIKQGVGKSGKPYRGEYCPNNECEVMWWRLSGVDDHKYWVAPIYDPYEFVYVGMKDTPWENL